MNFEVKPNFKICGKMFGSHMKEFQEKLVSLSEEDITTLESNGTIKMEVDHEEVEVTPEMVEIRVSSKEGFNASHEENHFIVLNTTLTSELINEGIVREFISKVQNLRKTKDFEITDRIKIYYTENNDFENAISNYIEIIKKETLALDIIKKELDTEEVNLNGVNVKFDVERVSK